MRTRAKSRSNADAKQQSGGRDIKETVDKAVQIAGALAVLIKLVADLVPPKNLKS